MSRILIALSASLLLLPHVGAQTSSTVARGNATQRVPRTDGLRAYVGRYALVDSASGAVTPLRIVETAGVLSGQLRTNAPSVLRRVGPHTFSPADAPDFVIAFTVARGSAVQVTLRGPQMVMRGTRVADTVSTASARADETRTGPLFEQLARADSLLFDASFVRCDTSATFAILSDDVEFYHDLTGAHRGAEVRADFARLARDCPRDQGMRRELVPGSLQVYPIKDFGAVQMGEHRFVRGAADPVGGARFVHVWQSAGGVWRVVRIVSVDHHAESAR